MTWEGKVTENAHYRKLFPLNLFAQEAGTWCLRYLHAVLVSHINARVLSCLILFNIQIRVDVMANVRGFPVLKAKSSRHVAAAILSKHPALSRHGGDKPI